MTLSTRITRSLPTVAILLTLTAVLRVVNLAGSPARLDDEGTYVAQAYAVLNWGELAHYTYWYDHPPAGWLQLALWTAIVGPDFGGSAVIAGRCLMVGVAVVTAGLLWALGRRIGMSRVAAAAAVALYAVSPLAISLTRAVYLDNLAIAWLLGALVLICSPRHKLSAMFGAAICFGVSVLTKETMVLFLPVVALLVWLKTDPATRRYALAVLGAVFGVVVSTYVLMAVVRGELIPGPGHVSLWQGIEFQLWQRAPGGGLGDPDSLKRHTIDEWLQLDPVLPLLAVPLSIIGLLVNRLRPFAIGALIPVVTTVRPGYLPVPFVIAMLPLTALLVAGVGEVAVHRLRRAPRPSVTLRRLRTTAVMTAVLVVGIAGALWWPSYHTVLTVDEDASLRQAQQWISVNVPKGDRMIVDDAVWVDLVQDGRDRRNVVWSYKVDTDEQVKTLAPHGWADYGWVVSTDSMRANTPPSGVLTDALSHAKAAASFGSGGKRVDVLRVVKDSPAPVVNPAAAPAFSSQIAARMAASADPRVLGILQSQTVDQRVVATLAVVAAMEDVELTDVATTAAEDLAGTPRREFTLSGSPSRLRSLAAFFTRQTGPFAVESARVDGRGLTIRFSVASKELGLGAPARPAPEGTAALRVADVRRTRKDDHLEFVRIDGTPAGSLPSGDADYRSMPAGTYVLTTVAAGGDSPVLRQVFTVEPDTSYTLALSSAAGSDDAVAAQLAPDRPSGAPDTDASLRLLQAADGSGAVDVALAPAGGGEPTVLAHAAAYGLITGYVGMPAGPYDAVVTAHGHERRQPLAFDPGSMSTLHLVNGPDGPWIQQLRDQPDATTSLDPPEVTAAPSVAVSQAGAAKTVSVPDPRLGPVGLIISAALVAAGAVLALRRRKRRLA